MDKEWEHFKAWKIASAKRDLARAANARKAGHLGVAAMWLRLAAVCRRSLRSK